jgi:nucleotide-binding universal stress UspA family protein
MPFKDILVAVPSGSETHAGGDYAISMGRALEAHVTAVTFALEPSIPYSPFGGIPATLLRQHREGTLKEAKAAATRFDEAAQRAGVTTVHAIKHATVNQATSALGELARTFDLTILGQTQPGIDHFGDLFVEAALFHSGRPIVIVPMRHQFEFSVDRVLIAWDGSLHAARAVASAMPLIRLAGEVGVVIVREEKKSSRLEASELLRHLQRHGLIANLSTRDEDDIPTAIAAEAEAWRASVLIMGAYGHSRIREIVFGGVTRFMLTATRIPTVLVH